MRGNPQETLPTAPPSARRQERFPSNRSAEIWQWSSICLGLPTKCHLRHSTKNGSRGSGWRAFAMSSTSACAEGTCWIPPLISVLPTVGCTMASTAQRTRYDNLHDVFEFEAHLGNGKHGEVHKVIDTRNSTVRALKVIEKDGLKGKSLTMVERETEILRRCNHPNILHLYEIIETPTQICLLMEYVEGGDLYEYIVQRKSLTEQEAARITKGILQAVEYLHNASPPVVHRDIKPENVLIGGAAAEKVLLGDFGMAKVLSGPTVECTPGGTSFYLPPEIIEGMQQHGTNPRPSNIKDMKSLDLWSTGVVLYILLCGSPPFKGVANPETDTELQLQQIRKGVDFPLPAWAGVSDGAKNLVRGLLQVDPTRRLNVRQALADPWLRLQEVTAKEPVQLETPKVLASEYRNKEEFHIEVGDVCNIVAESSEAGAAAPAVAGAAQPTDEVVPPPPAPAEKKTLAFDKSALMKKKKEKAAEKPPAP
eukprot:TRINITY_DN1292_c0_g1_i1.p1 TRINITY_DN1292_c0_g1~~TRINITY_DN1292_c0_g1_i1.p1  ORF type:complete len:480 (-),score=63.20 TRINITY_DN1292_c0_g1_i1:7-1446(-)